MSSDVVVLTRPDAKLDSLGHYVWDKPFALSIWAKDSFKAVPFYTSNHVIAELAPIPLRSLARVNVPALELFAVLSHLDLPGVINLGSPHSKVFNPRELKAIASGELFASHQGVDIALADISFRQAPTLPKTFTGAVYRYLKELPEILDAYLATMTYPNSEPSSSLVMVLRGSGNLLKAVQGLKLISHDTLGPGYPSLDIMLLRHNESLPPGFPSSGPFYRRAPG